jgi:hypothetical protein
MFEPTSRRRRGPVPSWILPIAPTWIASSEMRYLLTLDTAGLQRIIIGDNECSARKASGIQFPGRVSHIPLISTSFNKR